PVDFTSTRSEAVVAVGLAVLGAAIIVLALVNAMVSSGGPHRLTSEEDHELRDLLSEWGWVDSLGYFATRDDRSIVFSRTRRSAVSYRVIGGVTFAAGDPLAPRLAGAQPYVRASWERASAVPTSTTRPVWKMLALRSLA